MGDEGTPICHTHGQSESEKKVMVLKPFDVITWSHWKVEKWRKNSSPQRGILRGIVSIHMSFLDTLKAFKITARVTVFSF